MSEWWLVGGVGMKHYVPKCMELRMIKKSYGGLGS